MELELVLAAGVIGEDGNSSAGRFFQVGEPLAIGILEVIGDGAG